MLLECSSQGGLDGSDMCTNGEEKKGLQVLVRNHEGKRPLGKPRRRWEDDIIIDLREVG